MNVGAPLFKLGSLRECPCHGAPHPITTEWWWNAI